MRGSSEKKNVNDSATDFQNIFDEFPKVKEYIDSGDFKVIYQSLKKVPKCDELKYQVGLRKGFNDWFLKSFETRVEAGPEYVWDLYEILKQMYGDKTLNIEQTALFIDYFHRKDQDKVIQVYEEQLERPVSLGEKVDPLAAASEIMREHLLVAYNKVKHISGDSTIRVGTQSINLGHENGEVYGAIGRAYKDLGDLEMSTKAYLAGFKKDFEYYPGINVIYNFLSLGENKKALEMAKLVDFSTRLAGGMQSKDYWCLATQVELACILNQSDEHINELLKRLENHAETSSFIDWTLSPMKHRREQLNKLDEDISTYDKVINKLESIANGDRIIREIKEGSLEDKLSNRLFNYLGWVEGPTASYIKGNVRFGGQLHAHMVSREDIKNFKYVLGKLIDANPELENVDIDLFNTIVDGYLWVQFRTSAMEDPDSEQHEQYDMTHKGSHNLFLADEKTEGLTSLSIDLMLGLGDCRQHAYSKQLFFDVWKRRQATQYMKQAYKALENNDKELFNEKIEIIDDLLNKQMYVADTEVFAPIKVENGERIKVVKKDGVRLLDNKDNFVEEHSLNVFIEDGQIYLADSFYQMEYDLSWSNRFTYERKEPVCSVDEFLEKGYIPGGKIEVLAEDDSIKEVEVKLFPTPYAGARHEELKGNYGGLMFRGFPIENNKDLLLRGNGLKNDLKRLLMSCYKK